MDICNDYKIKGVCKFGEIIVGLAAQAPDDAALHCCICGKQTGCMDALEQTIRRKEREMKKNCREEFEREIARVKKKKRRRSKIKEATKRATDEKLKEEEANAMSAGVEAQKARVNRLADLMDSAVDNTLEDCKADAEAEKTKRLKRSRRPNAEVTASERKDEAQAVSEEAEDDAESFV